MILKFMRRNIIDLVHLARFFESCDVFAAENRWEKPTKQH